jgi:hypothetical protein
MPPGVKARFRHAEPCQQRLGGFFRARRSGLGVGRRGVTPAAIRSSSRRASPVARAALDDGFTRHIGV